MNGTTDIAERVDKLERTIARLEAELCGKPDRKIIPHTDPLPVIRGALPADIVARGSGSDVELFMYDGENYVVLSGTPNSITGAMLDSSVADTDRGIELNETSHKIAAQVDGATINFDGSGQLEVPDAAIDETKRVVAATQTITEGTPLVHSDAPALHVTMSGSYTCTVANGTNVGQALRIVVVATGTNKLTLDTSDANLNLRGDWQAYALYGPCWIELEWNGSAWDELRRAENPDNFVSVSGLFSMTRGVECEATGTTAGAGGYDVDVSGANAFGWGNTIVLAGDRSFAFGANLATIPAADYGGAFGQYALSRHVSEIAFSGSRHSVDGDSQGSVMNFSGSIDGEDSDWHTLASPDDFAPQVYGNYTVLALVTGATEHSAKANGYLRLGVVRVPSTPTLVGQVAVGTDQEDDADWDVQLAVESDHIVVQVKDASAPRDPVEPIKWNAVVIFSKLLW